jgi:hypothetical protein
MVDKIACYGKNNENINLGWRRWWDSYCLQNFYKGTSWKNYIHTQKTSSRQFQASADFQKLIKRIKIIQSLTSNILLRAWKFDWFGGGAGILACDSAHCHSVLCFSGDRRQSFLLAALSCCFMRCFDPPFAPNHDWKLRVMCVATYSTHDMDIYTAWPHTQFRRPQNSTCTGSSWNQLLRK